MGCFRRERPPTRAIPDIRLLDGLDDHLQQLKDLKNRIWRAISRALGANNVRSMARTVNSLFRKHVHGRRRVQRKPDPETAAPIPYRTPDVSPEPVADSLPDLGPELPPYVNFDKLTDAILAGTGMFARFDEHEEPNSNCKSKVEDINGIIDEILKSDDDERPSDQPPKKAKKVSFKITDELDQMDDTLTEALKLSMRIKHNDRQLRKRQLTRPQSILVRSTAPGAESLSPRANAGGDIRVQTPVIPQNPQPLQDWPDSEDELEEAIDVIFRNMGDGPQV